MTPLWKKENPNIKEDNMDLSRVFRARSVAVIGASLDETKRGYQAIKTLQKGGFEGDIYPVNPKLDVVRGIRCYASVTDIHPP